MGNIPAALALPEALRKAEKLPTLPLVAFEVLRLCRNEETTLDDLAETLSRDTALAARLLRFANSSLYNLGHEVTSLQRAALILGMKTVQLMALSFSLASSLPRQGVARGFDHPLFWRRSMAAAVAGRSMASLAGTGVEDEAFLCGLLGEIGQLVLAQCMEEQYAEVLAKSTHAWPTLEEEREILGFHSADIGGSLLRSWDLPALICAGVAHMHDPALLPTGASHDVRTLVHVMHLSVLTVDLLTSEVKGDALATIEDRAQEYFGLLPDAVYSYITSLEPGIREASEMLSMPIPPGMTHEEILDEARHQMRTISADATPDLSFPRTSATTPHRTALRSDPTLRDELTGLPDPQAFARFLEAEIDCRKEDPAHPPLGLLLVRVDAEEQARAEHGRAVADELLMAVSRTMEILVRGGDLPARLGRRDFAVILSAASPFGLRTLAERLTQGLAEVVVHAEGHEVTTTATMAGACLAGAVHHRDAQGLHEVVRRLLARALHTGPGTLEIHGAILDNRHRFDSRT